jgi:hypothetical protein
MTKGGGGRRRREIQKFPFFSIWAARGETGYAQDEGEK